MVAKVDSKRLVQPFGGDGAKAAAKAQPHARTAAHQALDQCVARARHHVGTVQPRAGVGDHAGEFHGQAQVLGLLFQGGQMAAAANDLQPKMLRFGQGGDGLQPCSAARSLVAAQARAVGQGQRLGRVVRRAHRRQNQRQAAE